MKRLGILGCVATTLLLLTGFTGSASASVITVDGSLSDWGVTIPSADDSPLTAWVPTPPPSGADFVYGGMWYEDSSAGGYVGPGWGGQDNDLEVMYAGLEEVSEDDWVLYFSLVTGFDVPAVGDLEWGDVFLDFGYTGGTPDYDLAILLRDQWEPSTGNEHTATGVDVYLAGSGSWTTSVTGYGASNPWRVDETSDATLVTGIATAAFSEGVDGVVGNGSPDNANPGDHNAVEFSLDLDDGMLAAWYAGSLYVHYTVECGNDVINFEVPIEPPRPPDIPEPATFGLLGLGLAGVILRRRFWA